jgi:hypothetical protein
MRTDKNFQRAVLSRHERLFVVFFVTAVALVVLSVVTTQATTIGTDITVTGNASSTAATSTAYLYVGPDGVESSDFDFAGGDLFVADILNVAGNATTSGDMFVGGGTLSLTKGGGATTTDGLFAQNTGTATTTISAGIATGDSATDSGGCLELVQNGVYYACVINDGLDGIACSAARCED